MRKLFNWVPRLVFRWRNGFYKHETWNLENTIARFILPRLVYLRDTGHSYANETSSEEEWFVILSKMIESFEFYSDGEDTYLLNHSATEYCDYLTYVQEGLELFAEYFGDLWD